MTSDTYHMAKRLDKGHLINEYINYGGMAYTRREVYSDVLECTDSHWAADLFAFGPNAQVIPKEEMPYYLSVRQAVELEGWGS